MSIFRHLFRKKRAKRPQTCALDANTAAQNPLESILGQVSSVCFIGDSITAGSENGGVPWYTPIIMRHPSLLCHSFAAGGGTSSSQLKAFQASPVAADVYIIAVGTNDVRYRDAQKGAVCETQFIENIQQIVTLASSLSPAARFVFIAPWCSIPEDPIPPISPMEKEVWMQKYQNSLEAYCLQHEFVFINPNPSIRLIVNDPILRADYLIDHIHPNGAKGVYLYAAAVYHHAQHSSRPNANTAE